MEELGFSPVPRSGAGWIHKEDGENEALLCQLKSTDKESLRLQQIDLERLAYHAAVSHKMPLFAVQFLSNGKIYFVIEKDKFADTAKAYAGKSKTEQASLPLPCAEAPQEAGACLDMQDTRRSREDFEQVRNLVFERRAQERRARCRGFAAALRAKRREEMKNWKIRKQL